MSDNIPSCDEIKLLKNTVNQHAKDIHEMTTAVSCIQSSTKSIDESLKVLANAHQESMIRDERFRILIEDCKSAHEENKQQIEKCASKDEVKDVKDSLRFWGRTVGGTVITVIITGLIVVNGTPHP